MLHLVFRAAIRIRYPCGRHRLQFYNMGSVEHQPEKHENSFRIDDLTQQPLLAVRIKLYGGSYLPILTVRYRELIARILNVQLRPDLADSTHSLTLKNLRLSIE